MTGRAMAIVVTAWSAVLGVLAILLPAMGEHDALSLSQLPAAAVGALVIAGAAVVLREPEVLHTSELSVGAPAVAIGLVLAVAGAAVGLWLVLAALPLVVAGVVALVMEVRG